MNLNQMAVVITFLVTKLFERGSWCGEIHIQKGVYFLQELFDVPLGFTFVLYRFGPFSFDLRYELTSLRTYGFLTLKPHLEYPPKFICTPICARFWKRFPRTMGQYESQVSFVANLIGSKGAFELERLTTAWYVAKRRSAETSTEEVIDELCQLKPHIDRSLAKKSFEFINEIPSKLEQLYQNKHNRT